MFVNTMKTIVNLNYFGEDAEFHHAGFAVKSIDDIVPNVEKTLDKINQAKIAMVTINNVPVELIEPYDERSPVNTILKKQQSLYHLCFAVKDIKKAVEKAREHGFHAIAVPLPAKAFYEKNICWLFSRVYGLIELIEK